MNCKYCKADCVRRGEHREKECKGYMPMTNADRIRAMSDEGLAELIVKHKPLYSWPKAVREIWMQRNVTKVQAWVTWLQQPAEGEWQ